MRLTPSMQHWGGGFSDWGVHLHWNSPSFLTQRFPVLEGWASGHLVYTEGQVLESERPGLSLSTGPDPLGHLSGSGLLSVTCPSGVGLVRDNQRGV